MKIFTPSLALFFSISAADAAISLDGSSSSWISLGDNFDFSGDQGTGIPASDIVGNGVNPGFYTSFDDAGTPSLTDGFVAFRVRLNTAGNGGAFTGNVWFGIDADMSGSIDAFIGVGTQGQSTTLGIHDAGTGLNTSPNTTSIASLTPLYTFAAVPTPSASANFNYRAVTAADGGAQSVVDYGGDGNPDYYLSCIVSFNSLVNFITANTINPQTSQPVFNAQNPFNQNSLVRYVVTTSNQRNTLNQDIGGIGDTEDRSQTWVQLGGFSNTVTVPEVSSTLLALIGSVFGMVFHRRR